MTIKEARLLAGLTQKQVSDMIGIPVRTLQNYEEGKRTCPSWIEKLILDVLCEKINCG